MRMMMRYADSIQVHVVFLIVLFLIGCGKSSLEITNEQLEKEISEKNAEIDSLTKKLSLLSKNKEVDSLRIQVQQYKELGEMYEKKISRLEKSDKGVLIVELDKIRKDFEPISKENRSLRIDNRKLLSDNKYLTEKVRDQDILIEKNKYRVMDDLASQIGRVSDENRRLRTENNTEVNTRGSQDPSASEVERKGRLIAARMIRDKELGYSTCDECKNRISFADKICRYCGSMTIYHKDKQIEIFGSN